MQDEKRRPATLKLIEFANWFVCPELVSRTLKSCRLVGQSKRCFKWIFLPCRHFLHFTINAHFSICITCVDVLWRVCMTSHRFLLLYAATQDGKWRPWSQTAWLGSRLRAHTGKGTKAFPWNHQRLIMMNSTPFSPSLYPTAAFIIFADWEPLRRLMQLFHFDLVSNEHCSHSRLSREIVLFIFFPIPVRPRSLSPLNSKRFITGCPRKCVRAAKKKKKKKVSPPPRTAHANCRLT